MSSAAKEPLTLDHSTIKEIVDGVWRTFMLHSGNISFHFDYHAITIMVHAREPFILPHGPVDLRTDGKQFETFRQVP